MPADIVLASQSETRMQMLQRAGIEFRTRPARVDEAAIRDAMVAEGAPARDIADALAEAKARRIAGAEPQALVIGADQVLEHNGGILAKPGDPTEAQAQIARLAGRTHRLFTAAVVYEDARPVWRHVTEARLTMRPLSDAFIADYVDRNWEDIRHSVGGYRIEDEGVRLFTRIEGSHFAILGLPLLELISYFHLRGVLAA